MHLDVCFYGLLTQHFAVYKSIILKELFTHDLELAFINFQI